jgi:oligopeptide/dipeptide ABC transporter ATP-binding protein
MTAIPTLEIEDLSIAIDSRTAVRNVVDDVTITVGAGEIVAVIGESGSGKTLTALAVLGLLPRQARMDGGTIRLKGEVIDGLASNDRRRLLGDRIAFVPQDALRALNPTLTVGDQVGEPFVEHRRSAWSKARSLAITLLGSVHLREPARRVGEYPHQFSGGMQQRAMIAMGIALEPELLVADEPTTALDVTVQAQVIQLLREIRRDHGTSILFITHDLGLVSDFCDRVYVMYAGRVVEEGPVGRIFEEPRHPYTRALLQATPSVLAPQFLNSIPGQIPAPNERPPGCIFAPRCPRRGEVCGTEPPRFDAGDGQRAWCWFP